jgi:hypothetical protein
MVINDLTDEGLRPAGYVALIERYHLRVISNWHESFVAEGVSRRIESEDSRVRETYPASHWPGDSLGDHLEFALKYDGTNLAILACIFRVADADEFTAYVRSKPTGKFARRLWYFYEMLTGQRLSLDDLKRGSYVGLLDPEEYYTPDSLRAVAVVGYSEDGKETHHPIGRTWHVRRQRIDDNLLGDARFCPMIRRTNTLRRFASVDLLERCKKVMAAYSPELLKRALSYLFTKETKSSFEIEHIKPDANRTERFVALLQLAEKEDFCDKPHLIDLQNRIVDPRFAATDYRKTQNYVGETVAWQAEKIHFASPKPEDLPDLMDGLIAANQRMDSHKEMNRADIAPVVHAAVIAYGFVFLHPFEDGNGRIHRFLVHNILARSGFTPEGLMFPVSAVMLKNPADYEASLEAFSRPLMPLVEYSLDEDGRMTVHNDTALWYRYIDMTPQAEALFAFIEKTIDTELASELAFLANYDRTKAVIQAIVDMPDRQIDLFIRLCLQNGGQLSAGKRVSHFDFLTDEEVAKMEQAVQAAYGKDSKVP